jgi:hypothetical protein
MDQMTLSNREKNNLRNKKIARNKKEFQLMREAFTDRITILSEGDSWFAYPPKWLFGSKPANLIDHISAFTRRKANFFSMASNGDEAVDMVSGKQKHELVFHLRRHQKIKRIKPIDLLLFSGGGNDIVGENDFERFLKRDCNRFSTARSCINMDRLKRKAKQISLSYQELLDIRDHYSPDTVVMTHTYDYPFPSLVGGVFLGGLIKTKAWMKRFMDEQGVKENLQADVIKIFMDTMAVETLNIASKRDGFIVIDSRGTLEDKKEWLNEIHPTAKGFKEIAEKMFDEMKRKFPELS